MSFKFNIRFCIAFLLLVASIPSLAKIPPSRFGTQLAIFEFCEQHTGYKLLYQNQTRFFAKAHSILKRVLSTYSEGDLVIAQNSGYNMLLLIRGGNDIQRTILCNEQYEQFKDMIE